MIFGFMFGDGGYDLSGEWVFVIFMCIYICFCYRMRRLKREAKIEMEGNG